MSSPAVTQFDEIMRRLRRIETRQYRHAQLQGLDITDTGDKVRVQYDALTGTVHISSLDVSLSAIAKVLALRGVTDPVGIYHGATFVGSIHAAAVCAHPANVTTGDTPQ